MDAIVLPFPQTDEEIIVWLNAKGNYPQDEDRFPQEPASIEELRENLKLTPIERLQKAQRRWEEYQKAQRNEQP